MLRASLSGLLLWLTLQFVYSTVVENKIKSWHTVDSWVYSPQNQAKELKWLQSSVTCNYIVHCTGLEFCVLLLVSKKHWSNKNKININYQEWLRQNTIKRIYCFLSRDDGSVHNHDWSPNKKRKILIIPAVIQTIKFSIIF